MGKNSKEFGIGKKGKIGISLEKPHYIAGETVRGTIYVSVFEPIVCDALVLKATGKEKVEFIEEIDSFDGEGGEVEHEVENVFFKEKIVICAVQHALEPGNYMYNFEYYLKEDLPGVFNMESYCDSGIRNLEAKIKYKFKATLDVGGQYAKDLKADCLVVVHSRMLQALAPSEDSTTCNVTFLCCIDKGTCTLSVAMDKNAYLPGETAQLICNINNNSEAEVRSMNCFLWQDISVFDGEYRRTFSRMLAEQSFPGVKPNCSVQQPQPLALVPMPGRGFLNPSTNSNIISCSYRIEVECDIPMCPDVELHLPVTILAPAFQQMCWVPDSTAGFAPTHSA